MIIYNILFYFYLVLLVFWGSKKIPGFSSWHMFANLNMMIFNLEYKFHDDRNENWQRLEPFNYLPHTHLSMSKNELKWFLVYLGKIKNIEVRGECIYYHENKITKLKILKNRISNDK